MSASLADLLNRTQQLRYQKDPAFARSLSLVTNWRADHMRRAYADYYQHRRTAAVLDYYFERIFGGIDLSEFYAASRTVKLAEKLFTGTDMLHAALEFNALAGETNQTIAECLAGATIDENRYQSICTQQQLAPQLSRQLDCFAAFADGLNTTVHDRRIGKALKLARIPAKIGGFPMMYELVWEGYSLIKKIDEPEALAAVILERERLFIDRMQNGQLPLYPES